jgi:hypothetical protein
MNVDECMHTSTHVHPKHAYAQLHEANARLENYEVVNAALHNEAGGVRVETEQAGMHVCVRVCMCAKWKYVYTSFCMCTVL